MEPCRVALVHEPNVQFAAASSSQERDVQPGQVPQEARATRDEQEKTLDQLYIIRSVHRPSPQSEPEDNDVDMDEGTQRRFELAFYNDGPLGIILIECFHPR